jgi:hypothetical protein
VKAARDAYDKSVMGHLRNLEVGVCGNGRISRKIDAILGTHYQQKIKANVTHAFALFSFDSFCRRY